LERVNLVKKGDANGVIREGGRKNRIPSDVVGEGTINWGKGGTSDNIFEGED